MKLVNAITVVNNLKTTYHITGKIGLFLIPHLLSNWVLIWGCLSHFDVVILLGLHSALECSNWSVGIEGRLAEVQGDFLWVFMKFFLVLLLDQLGQVGNKFL